MAGGSLAERRDGHQHGDIYARKSVVVSVSVDHRAARTRHPDAVALDAAVELAAVLVLLVEGPERVEEGPAALVEHALVDDLVGPQQERLRDRQAQGLGSLEIDD
jgi:hypothetical protein